MEVQVADLSNSGTVLGLSWAGWAGLGARPGKLHPSVGLLLAGEGW